METQNNTLFIDTQKNKRNSDELFKSLTERMAVNQTLLDMAITAQSDEVEDVNIAMIRALENACYFNDADTGNHLKRVSKYSLVIAERLGCNEEFLKRIRLYAPLHDVGKVGIPDNILKKKGRFTEKEAEIMREHVKIGARFLDNPQIDPMAKNIALYHHEKWDGSGYPRGLEGEQIPLEARILSVADVYDALSFDRVYRKALPEAQIDDIFRLRSGTYFDPSVIDAYFKVKNRLIEIKERGKG